jgi:endonuclease IV
MIYVDITLFTHRPYLIDCCYIAEQLRSLSLFAFNSAGDLIELLVSAKKMEGPCHDTV